MVNFLAMTVMQISSTVVSFPFLFLLYYYFIIFYSTSLLSLATLTPITQTTIDWLESDSCDVDDHISGLMRTRIRTKEGKGILI